MSAGRLRPTHNDSTSAQQPPLSFIAPAPCEVNADAPCPPLHIFWIDSGSGRRNRCHWLPHPSLCIEAPALPRAQRFGARSSHRSAEPASTPARHAATFQSAGSGAHRQQHMCLHSASRRRRCVITDAHSARNNRVVAPAQRHVARNLYACGRGRRELQANSDGRKGCTPYNNVDLPRPHWLLPACLQADPDRAQPVHSRMGHGSLLLKPVESFLATHALKRVCSQTQRCYPPTIFSRPPFAATVVSHFLFYARAQDRSVDVSVHRQQHPRGSTWHRAHLCAPNTPLYPPRDRYLLRPTAHSQP